MTVTNKTTNDILQFLFTCRVFAWRHNVLPIPISRSGVVVGFRSGSKSGLPDIMGIIGPGILAGSGRLYGVPLWIEVKTGKDRLRPEQIGAHFTARKMGAIVMVVKDYENFIQQLPEAGLSDILTLWKNNVQNV